MIVESRDLPPDEILEADVCVVGGGPAGIAIAHRLSGRGLTVLVLESGGRTVSLRQQSLNRASRDGMPYWELDACRARTLGGSGNFWGGYCRPLDPIDLAPHPDDPWRRWPITYGELSSYHESTSSFLGLPVGSFGSEGPLPVSPSAARAGLTTVPYRFSPDRERLGLTYTPWLESAPDVRVVLGATVRELRLKSGSEEIGHAGVDLEGHGSVRCQARRFVLATGAVENARLLLASDSDMVGGLGNQHDLVGRGFMEHLHAHVGYLVDGDEELRAPEFTRISAHPPQLVCAALASNPEVRDPELLGASLTVTGWRTLFGHGWRMRTPGGLGFVMRDARRASVIAEPSQDLGLSVPPQQPRARRRVVDGYRDVRLRRLAAQAQAVGDDVRMLYLRGEQLPHPDSRVRLQRRRDRLGVRRAHLTWQLQPTDLASAEGWVARLARAAVEAGAGRVVERPGWQRSVIGGPHHLGTTRMAADPSQGVVDADCRVHGLANLYVAGSSVFPTGGYANPTYSLVSLALRLADHLAVELGAAHGEDHVRP